MKTKNTFLQLFLLLLFAVVFYMDASSQKNRKYSCPLYKGKILVSWKASQQWGTTIGQAEIKSSKPEVYSSSPGIIIAIDTTFDKKVNIAVQHEDYVFVYDNLFSTESVVRQKVEEGQLIGKLKM